MKRLKKLLIVVILAGLPAFAVDKTSPEQKKLPRTEQTQSVQKELPKEEKTSQPAKPNVLSEEIKEDYREQARLFYNTHNTKQCLDMLKKIPDSEKKAQDWILLANISQDAQKQMDAIFYLERAALIEPKYYKSYYNLGNLYFENNNMKLAMENYRKAIKLKSDFAYAYYNIGCCYLKKKNYRLARYYFANAIKYNPEEPSFYYNIAYTYKMLKNTKRANDALKFYDELMSK